MPLPPPRIWIIVLTYNGRDDTRRCLRSLETVRDAAAVLVVDNASRDGTAAVVRAEFPWCRLLENPVNAGFAGGNNVGMRYALETGADWALLLNNDTVVAPTLVTRLAEAARARPEFQLLGPVINALDRPDEVMSDGCVFNPPGLNGFFQRLPVPVTGAGPPAVVEVDVVNGCCLMIAAEVVRRVGYFDERFFLYHEETDYCLRAARAGFRCGVVGDVLVWHKRGAGTKDRRRLPRYYDARNLLLLLSKHLGSPRRRRGPLASYWTYARYVYYRYCVEREEGRDDAADAVLEGLWDALARRFGPFEPRPRPAVPVLRAGCELLRRLS